MKIRKLHDGTEDLPEGYANALSHDFQASDRDLELGFCSYGVIDLDDMFGAFDQRQMGVVGGDKTVDDFTPEGIDWHTGDAGVGGATGNESRGSGRREGRRSSVPELRSTGDSEDEADEIGEYGADQGGRSSRDRGGDGDDDEDDYKRNTKRYP